MYYGNRKAATTPGCKSPCRIEPSIEDRRLLVLIRDSYTASSGVYDAPRVFADLREAGHG